MKNLILLPILMISTLLIGCNSSISENNLTIKKVGNYPHITWIKGKMLLSKDDKYLFVVNNKTPNQIDILDISDLSKPKLFKTIKVSDKKEYPIEEYKLDENKNLLYIGLYTEIMIYDISDVFNIKKVKEIPIQNSTSFVQNGQYLYISGCVNSKYCDDLNIYNLKQNKFIKKIDLRVISLNISPDKKRLFYGISPTKKEIIGIADISNPLNIKVLDETGKIFNNRGNFSTSATFGDIIFSSNNSKLFIAGYEVGLMAYNISNNKLKNIQLTAGTHKTMLFNSTKSIYNLALDKNSNVLYLAGVLDKDYKQIKSIKGVKETLLFNGKKIVISNRGDFLIIGNSDGLNFYKKSNLN